MLKQSYKTILMRARYFANLNRILIQTKYNFNRYW